MTRRCRPVARHIAGYSPGRTSSWFQTLGLQTSTGTPTLILAFRGRHDMASAGIVSLPDKWRSSRAVASLPLEAPCYTRPQRWSQLQPETSGRVRRAFRPYSYTGVKKKRCGAHDRGRTRVQMQKVNVNLKKVLQSANKIASTRFKHIPHPSSPPQLTKLIPRPKRRTSRDSDTK